MHKRTLMLDAQVLILSIGVKFTHAPLVNHLEMLSWKNGYFALLPSGLAQMNTRTLLPVGTWNGGSARTFPLMAALRRAESRGQGCLLPTPDGHMGGDFQRGCKQRKESNVLTNTASFMNECLRIYTRVSLALHVNSKKRLNWLITMAYKNQIW